MNLKGKVLASSLSLGMVVASIGGLPLSQSGLLSKLGIAQVASAATNPLAGSSIVTRMNAIHANLWTQEEIDAVKAARDALNNLADEGLVAEIGGISGVDNAELLLLFKRLGMVYYAADGSELLRALGDMRPILEKLAIAGGTSLGPLSIQDAERFATAIESALKATTESDILLALGNSNPQDAMKELIKNALVDVIENKGSEYGDLAFSSILNHLGITAQELASVAFKFIAEADDANKSASKALTAAMLRSEAKLISVGSATDNGRSQQYKLQILGKDVPNAVLHWTITGSDELTIDATNGLKVSLKSGLNNGSATLNASINVGSLTGTALLRQSVTMAAQSGGSGSGSGSGSSGTTPPPPQSNPVTQVSENTQKEITKLADEYKNATPEKKQVLLQQITNTVQTAVNQITTIDLGSTTTTQGNKTIVNVDVAAVAKQIQDIVAEIKKLTDQIKALDPNAPLPKTELTLSAPSTTTSSVEFSMPKGLMDAANQNGVGSVAVKMNGLTLAVNPKTFTADKLSATKVDPKTVNYNNTSNVASDMYELEFSSNNTKVTDVKYEAKFSVPNASKFDADLLTVVRVESNGTHTVFMSKFDPSSGNIAFQNTTTSLYTVIENKVEFKDTSSVSSWAGRQIQVAAAKGILEGRENGSFVPNGEVTRAEFIKMIVKTFALEDKSATESFNDVADSDWYKVYVASAVKAGLVNGRSEGKFEPNGFITRAEMATIASRALMQAKQLKAVDENDDAVKKFVDVKDINSTLKAGVAFAAKNGIVIGDDNNQFNPNANSTRAQAAVIIYRLLNK